MKQTHFETLTKANIEYDIKSLYKWKLKGFIPSTIFNYICIPGMWFFCGFSKRDTNIVLITILVLYLSISLYLTICSVYYIIQYFNKNIKYTIVSDTFKKTGVKHMSCYGVSNITYLCFSKYGKFSLDMHRWYYQWSDLYCMERYSIMDRAKPGDEFYLVIKNNKIINAYNKRMFQLDTK